MAFSLNPARAGKTRLRIPSHWQPALVLVAWNLTSDTVIMAQARHESRNVPTSLQNLVNLCRREGGWGGR
jgi:hypothetical protein